MSKIVEQRLKRLVEKRGLKQCWVATRAGIRPSRMYDCFNGRSSVQPEEVPRIAKAIAHNEDDYEYIKKYLLGEIENE